MPSLKKSLPVLGGAPGQRARPPAQSLWRSLQERLRGGVDHGEASAEFPAGATDADAPVEPRTAEEVISYYAKRISQDVKLPSQFASLVPKVREFLERDFDNPSFAA